MTITYLSKQHPNNSKLSGLTPKQIKVLPLVACGTSQNKITNKVDINRQTLTAYMKDQKFQDAVSELRAESLREAKLALSNLAMASIQTLSDVLHNSPSDALRLRASMYILDQLKITEQPVIESGEIDINLLLKSLGE